MGLMKGLRSNLGSASERANAANPQHGVLSRFVLPRKFLKAPESHLQSGSDEVPNKGMLADLLQKYSDHHEATIGVDIIPGHIRVCQMSEHRDSLHLTKLASVDIMPGEDGNKLDVRQHANVYVENLKRLIKKNKIKPKSVAVAIPVSSSIIKTITMPNMSNQEIEQAIEMGSFWENLVELPGSMDQYSIFYEVAKRDTQNGTMDIMFVAASVDDISVYTKIISDAGLNPIIVDVRCFALSNIFHFNHKGEDKPVVFLKFGPDENYIHIIEQGESFMYDIYISDEERNTMMDRLNDVEILQRYATQARQIISTHSSQHGSQEIKDIYVVSLLPAISSFVQKLAGILTEFNVSESDFFEKVKVPKKFKNKIIAEENKSSWAVVMGLAARRLVIFEPKKGIAGADNVNLLPGSEEIKQTKRANIITIVGLIPLALVFLVVAFLSYTSILKEDTKVSGELNILGRVDKLYEEKNKELENLKKTTKQLLSLEEIRAEFASNQPVLLSAYKHISSSTSSGGVWLTEINFTNDNQVEIKGNAVSDQEVLDFIKNLKDGDVFSKVSLKNMQVNNTYEGSNVVVKSFMVDTELAGIEVKKEEEKKGRKARRK